MGAGGGCVYAEDVIFLLRGENEMRINITKRKLIIMIGSALILWIVGFVIKQNYDFNHYGINGPLISEQEDLYKESTESELPYQTVSIDQLIVSKMFLIEMGDEIQIRFRFAYAEPFGPDDLFWDTKWKIVDSEGNAHEDKLTVYSSTITGIDTVGVALVMTREEFSELSGKELTITAYCTKGEDYQSYAHCKLVVKIP